MSHQRQRDFIKNSSLIPELNHFFLFQSMRILDIGSLDINGNNRDFFASKFYIGCDIHYGKNVDIAYPVSELKFADGWFDVIISTEAFEHDSFLIRTLAHAIRMLRSEGLFIFTCATTGREEHGTYKSRPSDSPFTKHYYKNVTEKMIRDYIDIDYTFSKYHIATVKTDLQFWGIKK
jgi:SAM-dependent methyltransferase